MALSFSALPPRIDADVILKIDYDEGAGSAARAFEIAAELIRSMEDLDRVLMQSIGSELSTALVVEDLKKSSLKIFLRNVLSDMPDDALKDVNLKKLIGHYLIKGKYAAIRYLDSDEKTARISDLTEEIAQLANETDARHLPDYPKPNQARLAQSLDRFQEVKRRFSRTEGLTITLGKDEYSVNLNETWLPSENLEPDEEDQELVSEQDVFLIIAKPDFIGEAKWSFKHGKKAVSYNLKDEAWLEDFRAGRYPIKPGDALRVRIRVAHKYNHRGDLLEADEAIIRVFSVIEGEEDAPPLL